MRNILLASFLFFLLCQGSLLAQSCQSPIGPIVYVNPEFDSSTVSWFEPGGCPVLYYEVRYSSNPFNPNTGGGTLISPIYDTFVELGSSGYTHAWVRSICDCEPQGGGDGIGDSDGNWVEAAIVILPPVIYPDVGLECYGAPIEPVELAVNCGNSGTDLQFIAVFHDEQITIPCTGENEYVLWRTFQAPLGGEMEVTMGISPFSGEPWDDFGFVIYDGCTGSLIQCEPTFSSADVILVSGLIPGTNYRIGSWNNDYPYFFWQDPDWGYQYNGTSNVLDLCLPAVSCTQASNFYVNLITDHTATLNWNANTSTQWNIEYGVAGFTPGEGTLLTGIETEPFTLTELDSDSEYEYYVTADCGDDGLSITVGPMTFTTAASLWVQTSVSNGSGYCCDEFSLAESFNVGAYCDSVYFTYQDDVIGADCDYLINRTITAHDTCGNSLDHSFQYQVIDNDIPCGCDNGVSIPDSQASQADGGCALHGDWAFFSDGPDKIMKRINGEWTLHEEIDLGILHRNGIDIFNDVFINGNKVYRLIDDEWIYETVLISSAGDSVSNTAAIYENEIAFLANGHLAIFEYADGDWNEIALFEQWGHCIDMSESLIGIAIIGSETDLGYVYRKVDGMWTFEQNLPLFDTPASSWPGYDVAIDGDHFATGTWYLGGLFTYHFDGISWTDGLLHENPFLIPSTGYNTAFGSAIDIEGDLMVVGDNHNKTHGNFSGSVTVYEWTCEGWYPQRSIVPMGGTQNMRFGGSVALDNGNLAVGIDKSYWLGGGMYWGGGNYYVYSCLAPETGGCPVQVTPGGILECGTSLPDFELSFSDSWNDEYTTSVELIGEMSCNDSLIRNIYVEDIEGNTGMAQQIFYFQDTQAPFLVCPEPDSVSTNMNGYYSLPDFSILLEASDLCDPSPSIFQSMDAGTLLEAGSYSLVIWAEDECENQYQCEHTITVDPYVGLSELGSINFTVYPNPAKDIIQVIFDQKTQLPLSIELTDVLGRVVKKEKNMNSEMSISISDLEIGTYELNLFDAIGNSIGTKVIVKNH